MRRVKSQIKRGKLSGEEKLYIEKMCELKTDAEIAMILKRPEARVQEHRISYFTQNPNLVSKKAEHMQLREDLHKHFQWEEFKKQFSKDELIFFENSYVELISQFRSDILPTERKQVFQAITLEIFMARHNRERMLVQADIDRLERMVNSEWNAKSPEEMSSADKERVTNMEGQLSILRQSSQSKTKEYKDLSDKYSSLIKELKGTREQRIQKVENSKQKFTDLLRMLEEEEIRNRVGVDMVIMEKAVEKETERLSQFHTYMDGEVDIPLLTPETYERISSES